VRRFANAVGYLATLAASAAVAVAGVVLVLSADLELARAVFGIGFVFAFLLLAVVAGIAAALNHHDNRKDPTMTAHVDDERWPA
jgi:hypothetical protein